MLVGPFDAREKSTPVPESARDCVEVVALSENVTVPVRKPVLVGEKTIWTVHTAAGATEVTQVLDPARMAKSPVAVMLENASITPPLLVSVTVCEEAVRPTPMAPNARPLLGESETPGGARPVPLNATV